MTDIADQAEHLEQLDRDIAIRQTLDSMRPSIPQVVRIDDDGAPTIVCYDCLAPIPPGRLAARPHAVRCVGCQEAEEKRARLEGR